LEHCLNRGLDNPYIQSEAASGTLIQHFKRGKRYINEGINAYLDYILSNTKKGERIFTGFLGAQKMFMPINLINELKTKIRINSLIKNKHIV
jgi:ADP-glucose pyrophosphorylase